MRARIFFLTISVISLPLTFAPTALGFEVKAKCISATILSPYPLSRPSAGGQAEYRVEYRNNCTNDIPAVEISLLERDGYDYRVLTSGGRLSRVLNQQKGTITLALNSSTFEETKETIFLSIKESYPLESKVEQSMRNVLFLPSFSSVPSPTPSKSPLPTSSPSNVTSPTPNPNMTSYSSAESEGLRITWPKQVYMPQTRSEENDPKLGYMVIEFENKNSSGFFYGLQANIYSTVELQSTGNKLIPTLGTHGPVNSGVKGTLRIPLSYLFFLGMKGPIPAEIVVCAHTTRLLNCGIDTGGVFSLEHLRPIANVQTPTPTPTPTNSMPSKSVTSKKSTIICVKGKSTLKVIGISPKCPSGYKKR
jgi:hypothetical protein